MASEMAGSLKRRTIVGALMAFVVLASIAALAVRGAQLLGASHEAVGQSREVIELIESARIGVAGTALAELRQKVGGAPANLGLEQDQFRVRGTIAALSSMVPSPTQQARIAGVNAALSTGATEEALRLLGEMAAEETALLNGRLDARQQNIQSVVQTLLVLAVGGGAILAGALFVIYRQTQAQMRTDRSRAALERRFSVIVDKMVVGLITTSDRGKIESVNPAAVRIFGYSPDELIGRSIRVLMAMSDEQALAALKALPGPALGKVTEWEARRKDGTTFPMELSLFEFQTDQGRHFAGNVRDISERREVDRMKSEFVSVVSHELRTPLTSVRGALQIVLDDPPAFRDPDHEPLLQIALKNCERLIRIINDILDVSKIEAGQVQLKLVPCDAADIVRSSLEVSGEMARAAGVRIVVEAPERPALIRVDPDRFAQVLTNLVSNAIKFSPAGGVVTVTTHLGQRGVSISVRDHGPGIAVSDIPRLFSKFKQLDSSATRARGGSGLGLAIAKALIEEHGGTISVESVVGQGSVFTLQVPYAESLERAPTGPYRASPKRSSASVILAEDDGDLREVLTQALSRNGFSVAPASNGRVARSLYDSGSYDAMVVDLHMPVADGFGLIEHVRQTPRGRELPIIVISGSNSGRGETRSMALGATSFLAKPVGTDELVRELHRVLEG
ncbi:MAG: hybrid sensor histidine kinase/response regulator [Acidobacteria bacterium]|nr:MAG: hybrid sensor histidine kinase/response regulator [Acidobacteriota bacterium]